MSELPGVIIQPVLQVSATTAAKIASGQAYIIGGVVREVGTGRLVELLGDAPGLEEAVNEAARNLAKGRLFKLDLSKLSVPKMDSKTVIAAGGVLLIAGAAVGGYRWATSRRTESTAPDAVEPTAAEIPDKAVDQPSCLVDFRSSLEAYVEAGKAGSLTAQIVGRLVADLDAVQAYADDGKAIAFTLDELLPFFSLVTAHTPVLAAAYCVDLDEVDETDDGVVVTLRKHLEKQKSILDAAA